MSELQFLVTIHEAMFPDGVVQQAVENAIDNGVVNGGYIESFTVRPV